MSERAELERLRVEMRVEKQRRRQAAQDSRRYREEEQVRNHRLTAAALRRIEAERAASSSQHQVLREQRQVVQRVTAELVVKQRIKAEERARHTEEKERDRRTVVFWEATEEHEAAMQAAEARSTSIRLRRLENEAFMQRTIKEETERQERLQHEHSEDMVQAEQELAWIEDQKLLRDPGESRDTARPSLTSSASTRSRSRGRHTMTLVRSSTCTPRQQRSGPTPTKHVTESIVARMQLMGMHQTG